MLHVGMRSPGPRVAHTIQGREVLIVLDVGCNPEGNPSVVWPFDDGPVDDGAVVYPVWG